MAQLARTASAVGRGVAAGVAGTAVMTAFQRYVEMPLTRPPESFTPAELAGKILHLRPATLQQRRRLNYAAHYAIGGLWGAAYGLAALAGLRGQRAANTVFAVVYGGGIVLGAATGQSHPGQWSTKDWAMDLAGIRASYRWFRPSVSTERRICSIWPNSGWPIVSGGASWITGSPRSSARQYRPASNRAVER
jgi:hypothetical protein